MPAIDNRDSAGVVAQRAPRQRRRAGTRHGHTCQRIAQYLATLQHRRTTTIDEQARIFAVANEAVQEGGARMVLRGDARQSVAVYIALPELAARVRIKEDAAPGIVADCARGQARRCLRLTHDARNLVGGECAGGHNWDAAVENKQASLRVVADLVEAEMAFVRG